MAKIFPHFAELPSYTDWGGYPILYVITYRRECCVLCAECATACMRAAHETGEHRAYKLQADVNYEDPDLYCEDCCERIESAYAEPDDSDETENQEPG